MSRDLSFRKITMEELTLKKGRGCLCVTHVAPRCAAEASEQALTVMMAGLVFRWMALKHSLLDVEFLKLERVLIRHWIDLIG